MQWSLVNGSRWADTSRMSSLVFASSVFSRPHMSKALFALDTVKTCCWVMTCVQHEVMWFKDLKHNEQHCLTSAHQWLMVLLLKHRMAQGVCPVGRSWHSLTPISSDHLFLFGGFTTDKQPLSKSFQKDFVFVFFSKSLNYCLVTLKSLYIPSTSCDVLWSCSLWPAAELTE